MKEDRKQELRRLLVESEKYVYIEHRGKVIPTSKYRKYYLYKGYDPLIRFYRSTSPKIKDSAVKTQLLDFIKSELSEYILDDTIYSVVSWIWGGLGRYTLEDFLCSLLRVSTVWGCERAIQNFERSIDENYVPFQHIALITGIKVESELKISDRIRLIPLPGSPEELPDYLPIDRSTFTESHFLGRVLFLIEKVASPAFFNPKNPTPSPQLLASIMKCEGEEFNPQDFCVVLSLICNNLIQFSIGWTNLSEDEFFSEFGGRGTTYFHHTMGNEINSRVTESQINDAKSLYHQWSNLESKVRNPLSIAIHRLASSQQDKREEDKMIDLGIAFESLYLKEGDRGQLAFSVSIRAAWFLGKNPKDRKRLMKILKLIYTYRSKAVHRGLLPGSFAIEKGLVPDSSTIENRRAPNSPNRLITMQTFIGISQDLCHQSIMEVIRLGKSPDWDDLIVGENAT